MSYECLICYDKCKGAISCTRCKQLMCRTHVGRFQNKCPHCRLQPFQWKEEKIISQLVAIQINTQRQQMKRNQVFKCLVEGCNFEGKYHPMTKHKKKAHYDWKIEEIIFQQEFEKKKRRDTLKSLIAQRLKQGGNNKTYQKAFLLFVKTDGKVPLANMLKLVQHLENCQDAHCKKIILSDNSAFIGTVQPIAKQSICPDAISLKYTF